MKRFSILIASVILLLSLSPAVYAEVHNMIGKKVQGQFPVKVNGVEIDVQAIVIDGTSYLPVRAIGEALNKEVKFSSDLGIEVNDKEVPKVSGQVERQQTSEEDAEIIKNVEAQIDRFKAIISENNVKIYEFEREKAKAEAELAKAQTDFEIMNWKATVEDWQTKINGLKEHNEMLEEGIKSSEAYIQKIRDKYTGG